MPPRRPLAETRQLLVDAAIRVIATRGLASASTRAITAEAGLSLSSFHYAFDSYDHLIDRVMEAVTDGERALAIQLQLPGGAPTSVDQALERAFDLYLDFLLAQPEYQRALLELMAYADRTPGLRRRATAYYDGSFALVAEAIEAAVTGTGAAKVGAEVRADLARLVVALLDGLTTTWLATRDDAAARATARLAASAVAAVVRPPSFAAAGSEARS